MNHATQEPMFATEHDPGHRGFPVSALGSLFGLTLHDHLRGRRLLILSLLFFLPSVLVVILRIFSEASNSGMVEFWFVFTFIPHGLVTLTALLYAAGIIQDEVEGQTLTYLLVRPLPRWALYLTKLAATICVTALLTGVFTVLLYAVIYWNTNQLGEMLGTRALQTVALMALAQAAYCSLFGALSLFTQRALLAGLAYIVLVEGLLANFDFVLRKLTIMYYFRGLALRWFELPYTSNWSLQAATAPSAGDCLLTLLGVVGVTSFLGAMLMTRREFLMKTPGGN